MDPQRTLWNLHRRQLPLEALRTTAQRYAEEGYMTDEQAHRIMQVIEQERGHLRITGDASAATDPAGLDGPAVSPKMSLREMQAELTKREGMMRAV